MKARRDIAAAMMQLDLARLRCEEINEFKAARIVAEYMLDQYIEMLDKGMPRSAIIEYLAHAACTSRKTAADVLLRVLKKAKYVPLKKETPPPAEKSSNSLSVVAEAKIWQEVSVGKPTLVTPKPDPYPAPAPIAHPAVPEKTDSAVPVDQEVFLATSDFKISALAELATKPAEKKHDKWAHLNNDGVVGRGFLGEEHRWMTPEEIRKEKEDRERLHRISNADLDRRKEIEKAKKQQKEASQTQPEAQPDKE